MLCVVSRKVKYIEFVMRLKMSTLYMLYNCFQQTVYNAKNEVFPWFYGTWVNKLNMARNYTRPS